MVIYSDYIPKYLKMTIDLTVISKLVGMKLKIQAIPTVIVVCYVLYSTVCLMNAGFVYNWKYKILLYFKTWYWLLICIEEHYRVVN
jgi:hypothetical protein